MWFFDRWSTHVSFRVHHKPFLAIKLLAYPRGLSLSRNFPILCHYAVASSCVCTSPLAVITVVGLLDVVTVSNSAEFKSFLLTVFIDAPESTTNSLSSGLIADGAGRHQVSEGEKNAVLTCSFNFRIFLASLHDASRAHRSLPFRLFLRPILKFWSIGVALMRLIWANHSERRILVSNVSMT